MSEQTLYIVRLLSSAISHGLTLAILIRSDERKKNMAPVMAVMTVLISLLGGVIFTLISSSTSQIYFTAFMMLIVMGIFFCLFSTGSSLVERLFIYIIYVAVFMLFVGFANCIAAILFPKHLDTAQIVIRLLFSILLIILLKLFLKDKLYSLVDGLCGQGVEITVFSWILGIFILVYVIFSALFIPDPGRKFIILCVLSLVVAAIFSLTIRIVRLADRKIEMERVLSRQRILEGELESERSFVEKAKALRHDQRHHDRMVLEFLEAGRVEEAKRYLGALDESMHAERLMSWCGNPLLDAQLRIAWRSCRLKGIDFKIVVNLPRKNYLNDIDFVSVVGNLLENAIEAASKCDSPYVSIYSTVSNGRLLMEIKNTFSGDVKWIGGNLETTKDGGGIGLRSVRNILSRHKGLLRQETEGNTFISRVILPIGD